MTRMVKLSTSNHGSIGSHWFLKKMKLDTYMSRKVPVPEGDEATSLLIFRHIEAILSEIL